MRKTIIVLVALFCVFPAFAQSPSGAVARATFQSFVATEFPDNTSGLITPADLRTGLLALSNSALFSFSGLSDLPTGPSTLPSGFTYPNATDSVSLTFNFLTGGGIQCLQVNNAGLVSGTGVACGSGGGGGSGTSYVQDYVAPGDFTPGSTTSLTVTNPPTGSSAALEVYFDGVHQNANTWSFSGSTLTFDAAIPSNVQVVEVQTAAATGSGLTAGTTPIVGGVSGGVLNDTSGVLEVSTTLPGGLSADSFTVTTAFTATGLVTNADLVSPTITINSTSCTLGGSCSIVASTSAVTVGTTSVLSGSNGYFLYNNGGTLGNLGTTGTIGSVVLSGSPTIVSPTITTSFIATGLVTLADMATQADNTVLANVSGGAASPTALSVSSCSAAGDALTWTTDTGFTCNTSITAAAVPASGITGTTLASSVVTTSVTTVGTIGTGVWAGTSIALAHGGTNNAITADNGGIIYSDASKLVLLASTGTAAQCLLSGNHAAPTWGSCSGAAAVASVADSGAGTLTISPTTGAVVAALNLGNANTWTAVQTFTNSDLKLLGSSTGKTTFTSKNSGASNYTLTFQAATGIVPLETEIIRGAGGRLTLQTGTPVMTTSQTGMTTIYYAGYSGIEIPYFDGVDDHMGASPASPLTLTASGTGVESANNVFDVWYFYNAGAPVLCAATNNSGSGWSGDSGGSNTARGSGYSAVDFSTRPYPTNSATISYCYNGGTNYPIASSNVASYLGSFCTDAATAGQASFTFGSAASGGGAARFCLWNYYNRRLTSTNVLDNGTAYSYTTASFRSARASTSNRITFLSGNAEDGIFASYTTQSATVGTTGAFLELAIGLDSTSTSYGNAIFLIQTPAAFAFSLAGPVNDLISPQVGLHFLQAVELSDGTHANSFDTTGINSLNSNIWN